MGETVDWKRVSSFRTYCLVSCSSTKGVSGVRDLKYIIHVKVFPMTDLLTERCSSLALQAHLAMTILGNRGYK